VNVCTPQGPAQHFNDWRVVKIKVTGRNYYFYIDDTLLAQRAINGPVSKICWWAITPWSMGGSIDYVRIYDTTGHIYYDQEFTDKYNLAYPSSLGDCDDCQTKFTKYYNKRRGTAYTFQQIDSVYYNALQYHVANLVCGSGPTLCGRSAAVFPPVTLLSHSPCDDSTNIATTVGTLRYQAYSDSLNTTFNDKYLAKCLNAYKLESFTVTQPMSEFHYTLYYYDQAGNLAKTVPPAGVDMSVFGRSTYFDSVAIARQNGTVYGPQHTLATDYRYNTLNQVVAQHTPDAGSSHFWYDRLGRLVVSQNAKQQAVSVTENNRLYSYTKYDWLGRINEVGQVKNLSTSATAMTDSISRREALLRQWRDTTLSARNEQVTRTYYDLPYAGSDVIPMEQKNLRNRVSYTSFTNSSSVDAYNQATIYSYDIHGNVDTLLQDYGSGSGTSEVWNIMNKNGNRWKRIAYDYDLISGKVNMVCYQPRYWDAVAGQYIAPFDCFYHRYTYDAENRLTLVETSEDSVLWEKDARYEYYQHGPLARMVLGDQMVQGLDYAYTLQGWLKGVNSARLQPGYDMGVDGIAGTQRQHIARDIFGYNLNYFTGDYSAISNGDPFPGVSAFLNGNEHPLFNGNISSMAVNIGQFNEPVLYNYKYDQLNRLKAMDTWTDATPDSASWRGLSYSQAFKERFKYDGNGNILHADRYLNYATVPMDSIDYHYAAGTNKLTHLTETDDSYSWVSNLDLETQPVDNYGYDAIGNLIRDSSENIGTDSIKWNVYGKIMSISRSAPGSGNLRRVDYTYDAAGNRIGKKQVYFGNARVDYTWYVRDAQGNVLNVYNAGGDTTGSTTLGDFGLFLQESDLYGSSRLGVQGRNIYAEPPSPRGSNYEYLRGDKFYEISNHLGNVVTVLSDKKMGILDSAASLSQYAYYTPLVVKALDYYSFGMIRRNYDAGVYAYRYQFNGKENDYDIKGDGDQLDYGNRIYDPRVGRFLSVDPITKDYPELTPYQFASNRPIEGIDLDGLEYCPAIPKYQYQGGFMDIVRAIDNGVINVANVVPTLWNSGVATVQSLGRGSYLHDAGSDFKQTGAGIKTYFGDLKNYTINTPITKQFSDTWNYVKSPQALEAATTFYVGGKVFDLIGKGSMLKVAVRSESEVTTGAKEVLKVIDNEISDVVKDASGVIVGRGSQANGTLSLWIKTSGTSLKGRGGDVFKALFNKASSYGEIKAIAGIWGKGAMGDNLSTFNSLIKSGKSLEEAALGTFTGKMSDRLGFSKVSFEFMQKAANGEYENVNVFFHK
jgi:RHS repeat-associated protein